MDTTTLEALAPITDLLALFFCCGNNEDLAAQRCLGFHGWHRYRSMSNTWGMTNSRCSRRWAEWDLDTLSINPGHRSEVRLKLRPRQVARNRASYPVHTNGTFLTHVPVLRTGALAGRWGSVPCARESTQERYGLPSLFLRRLPLSPPSLAHRPTLSHMCSWSLWMWQSELPWLTDACVCL